MSEKQRKFLWAKHPEIAEAWAHGRSSVTGKKESRRKKKRTAKRKARPGRRNAPHEVRRIGRKVTRRTKRSSEAVYPPLKVRFGSRAQIDLHARRRIRRVAFADNVRHDLRVVGVQNLRERVLDGAAELY